MSSGIQGRSVCQHFQNPKAPALLSRRWWHMSRIFYGSGTVEFWCMCYAAPPTTNPRHFRLFHISLKHTTYMKHNLQFLPRATPPTIRAMKIINTIQLPHHWADVSDAWHVYSTALETQLLWSKFFIYTHVTCGTANKLPRPISPIPYTASVEKWLASSHPMPKQTTSRQEIPSLIYKKTARTRGPSPIRLLILEISPNSNH